MRRVRREESEWVNDAKEGGKTTGPLLPPLTQLMSTSSGLVPTDDKGNLSTNCRFYNPHSYGKILDSLLLNQ